MATDLRSLPAFLADDATFRTWGSGIAAQLAAVGLVQTSDTGQINWTTVLKPTVVSTYGGYEIWRFADGLQATRPVFAKIEYGVGGAVDRPAMRITVSTATNGAGTPTGQVGVVRTLQPSSSKTAGATLPSYCSGSASRLNLCTNLDAATASFYTLLLVERTKTSAGVDTGDGIITWGAAPATAAYQFVPSTGTIPGSTTTNQALDIIAGGLSTFGGDVALAPTVTFYSKPLYASWCAYRYVDTPELTPITMTHLGATRTYMPLGDGVTIAGHTLNNVAGYSIAMLWE